MEINYELTKNIEEFKTEVTRTFKGIDRVVQELETEQNKLSKELEVLEQDTSYEVSKIKRKSTVKRELLDVTSALNEAIKERITIQESKWGEIYDQDSQLYSEYSYFIEEQLEGAEKEIIELIKLAKNKISEIKKVKDKANQVYTSNVVSYINGIVKEKGNSNVLGMKYHNFTKDLKERI